jgi:phosphoglycerate dehydrogenase-like enzyme
MAASATATRRRALVLAPFSASQIDALRGVLDLAHESWTDTRRLYGPEELAARLDKERIAVLVVESDFVFEEVFEGAPDLKLVGVCRSATHHVDVDAATAKGILVVNTPGRNAQAVAEHALGLFFSLARGIPAAHGYVRGGRWLDPVEPYMSMRGIELAGRTVGIIGLGAIGRRLASMVAGLGMKCIAFDPYVAVPPPGVTMATLDSLLAEADFVSVHVPATTETRGLIGDRQLAVMKQTAYLVTLSDAAVVSEEALVAALRSGRIAGAALDVFETHPILPTSPLLDLDNVVLTPHIGGATEETIERHSIMMVDDIRRFLAGRRPVNLVNPEAWRDGD